MRPLRWFVLVALGVSGCAGDKSPSPLSAFPSAEAFAPLGDVRLGMRVAQLRDARPRVEYAPYTGMREFTSDTVYYLYQGATSDPHSGVPGGPAAIGRFRRMRAIVLFQTFHSESLALAAWRLRSRDLARLGTATCIHVLLGDDSRQNVVELQVGDAHYAARVTGPHRAERPYPSSVWRLSTTVSSEPTAFPGEAARRTSTACPT
jgi:hypothetical protein